MQKSNYTIGCMPQEWGEGKAQTLTFIVTEDCNLRCKYCYITHKSKGKVLRIETARKFIDYIMTNDKIHKCEAVILDFIGGEPLLEAKLIDEICDYFKIRAYEEKIPWYWRYRINISTNGVNYTDKDVQNLIMKNQGKISIGITIDGTKEKHDLQRVFPDGTGSYDSIYKNLNLWLEQFPGNTKVTFASEDLQYLKESIIHLWNEGIYNVSANVVYENVWKEGDDILFERQLRELVDYIIDNDLYNKYYCTLFLEYIGAPYEKEELTNTSCGAGKMLALSPNGNIYPCMRYYDYSLNHKEGYIIGNVDDGIDFEKSRVFLLAMYKYQCDPECLDCPIAKGCEFCQGFSYDEADTATNFQKAKYICKMHKARVRANNYYFARLYHAKGIKRENFYWKNELIFLLDDNYVSGCSYRNAIKKDSKHMSREDVERGLQFAEKNFMKPVFLHSAQHIGEELEEYEDIEVLHRVPIEAYNGQLPFYDYQLVIDIENLNLLEKVQKQENVVLNVTQGKIDELSDSIKKILGKSNRVNINIQDITKDFNYSQYEDQLLKCVDILVEIYKCTGELKEVSNITDLLFIDEHEGCPAGESSIAYAPDGKFYICPAFYSEGMEDVGSPNVGIQIKNQHLYTEKYMPLCQVCDTYQCENCKYINRKYTQEVNVSPSFQCMKAQIERKAACYLQDILSDDIKFKNYLEKKEGVDPIYEIKNVKSFSGYYK